MKKKNIIGKIKFIVLLLIALTQLFPLYWHNFFIKKQYGNIWRECNRTSKKFGDGIII